MAGTLPILQIRSSILLVGLLTAIPMTYYNEGKIFKIFRFLTHPNHHQKMNRTFGKTLTGKDLSNRKFAVDVTGEHFSN